VTRSRTRRRPGAAVAEVDDRAVLRRELQRSLNNEQLLSESFAELASQMAEPGWQKLSAQFEQEFTAEGLRQIRSICRLFQVKNPLIKRGSGLRTAYVWSQGVEITARANGRKRREQDVQAVVAGLLDDAGNTRAFTGPAARERLERCLFTDGELFPVLFVQPVTGQVQIRVVVADDITEIICNPQDRSEPWYYRRVWIQRVLAPDGQTVEVQLEQLHPALGYRPKVRPKQFGPVKVAWDAPMLHVKVNDLEGWQRGIPDAYAAIDWALAYKVFLEDWARLVKSLSKFAWKMTAKGSAQQQRARTRISAPAVDANGRQQDVGNVAILPPDQSIDAIPKSGATIDSQSGKPLATMVAAALDVPLTMLLADPGQTGARAVAETLDQPTELAMGQRRGLWAGVYRRILQFAIAEAVRAPEGPLKGVLQVDAYGRESVKLNGNTDPTIDIDWPDLDADPEKVITAVVNAASTGTLPPEHIARLLLTALGVKNVDTLLEAMTDDEGRFVWPDGPPLGGPHASRDHDPGSMSPDDEPDEPEPVGDDTTPGDDSDNPDG
jgi:hypothetical protein